MGCVLLNTRSKQVEISVWWNRERRVYVIEGCLELFWRFFVVFEVTKKLQWPSWRIIEGVVGVVLVPT